jgi:uncharacterized protein YggU (UPF0235/DUF167 family)
MYIKVEAVPDAHRERIEQISETRYRVWVREPATRNLANRRIGALLADFFEVKEKQVRLLTGHRSSSKMYSVDRISD